MEKTTLDQAQIGSVIVRDVYGIDGNLLAKRGSTYQTYYAKRFHEHGVREIYVNREEQQALVEAPVIPASLNLHDVIHEKTRNHANLQMKKTLGHMKSVSNKNIISITKLVETMIEELLEKKDFVLALTQMRSIDDYTYQHSVNVGVLSLMMGLDLCLPKESLILLGTGAMLHDVGKTMIPEAIIKKPSKLTPSEYRVVQKHTEYGYEILRQTNIAEEAALIALHHHEKFDGSGYARGLKSRTIPLFSRIVAVADVYDAMSNDRVYQKKSSHDRVYREITHLGDRHFDSEIMEKFARHISIYPTGTGVILNTGQRGQVIEQNNLFPESPKIRIFTPEKKNIHHMYYDMNLALEKGIYIEDTF